MVAVVKCLHDNGYTVYVNSGTYRDALRVMTEGTLCQWISVSVVSMASVPASRVPPERPHDRRRAP